MDYRIRFTPFLRINKSYPLVVFSDIDRDLSSNQYMPYKSNADGSRNNKFPLLSLTIKIWLLFCLVLDS